MKILQVNCVYRKGSTGKIVADIHAELQKQGIFSVVCYGRGEKIIEPNVYKTCPEWYSKLNHLLTRYSGIMYGGLFISTQKLITIIEKEQPDIVHLHCINGYFVNIYRIVSYLKKHKIKTVLTLHAEFMYTANCGIAFECEKWKTGCGNCKDYKRYTESKFIDGTHRSWTLMKKAFEGFENLIITSVSPWLENRAKQSPILGHAQHTTVFNGLDTSIFKIYNGAETRKKYGISLDRPFVFHATASFTTDIHSLKGGRFICELANRCPNILFVVAGPYGQGLDIPENVKLLGRVADQHELAKLYSAADVTLITSKRETFSMVTAESLCCGTPVVGFKAGGPESIAIPEFSYFVDYEDVDAMLKAIYDLMNRHFDREQLSKQAHNCYSREVMTHNFIQVYNQIIDIK